MPARQETHIHPAATCEQARRHLIEDLAREGLLLAIAGTGVLWTANTPSRQSAHERAEEHPPIVSYGSTTTDHIVTRTRKS